MTARARAGGVISLLAWVDSLPWHGWWIFPVFYALLLVWSHVILWATGQLPFGTPHPLAFVGHFYAPYTLAALVYLDRVAQRSLVTFWPATGWPDDQREAWRDSFVHSPSSYGYVSLAIAIPVAVGAFLSAPAAVVGVGSDRAILFVAMFPGVLLGYMLAVFALLHTSRQLRLVALIHREAKAIDPFDRAPVYAFSQLTVRTGLAFVLIGYFTVTANASFQSGNLIGLAVLTAVFALGIACFILPLWGVHDRLVDAKHVLLRDVEYRLSGLGSELYRRIDAGQFDATKVISEAIASLTTLRERIDRLPTWPWPPQLLRGFLSALLLPVGVYLLTRLVASQVGM